MKKRLLLTMLGVAISSMLVTQVKAQQDSIGTRRSTPLKKARMTVSFGDHEDSTKNKKAPTGRFMGGITFTRLDLGFSRLIDNGSFSLRPQDKFLDYKGIKTTTVSFDVLYFGYRFNPNFKIYIAGGFDWTLLRLRNNVTIQPNTPDLTYVDSPVAFSKNRFSSSYVHIPFNFELRTKENDRGKRFYFIFGPEVSFLLNGKVKQISDEYGKQKVRDDYNFQPVRLGGTVRIGYGGIGFFTKYYFNDMFDSVPQQGLKNMAFGITLGLN